MGKAFEKQIKTIKNQGKKQVDALKDLKPKEQTKAIADKSVEDLLTEKETYNRLLNERRNEIQEISEKLDYNNLTYFFKDSRIPSINFIKFKGPMGLFKNIKNGDISLKKSRRRARFINIRFECNIILKL